MKKKIICNRILKTEILFFLVLGILYGCGQTSYFQGQSPDLSDTGEAEQENKSDDTVETEFYVDVGGAVKNPGVYRLKSGSRVYEAIQMAGGLNENADVRNLNQAAAVSDGEKIYICTIEEQQTIIQSDNTADGKVNINTASRDELMTLPGIGESKADAIIAYRQENGNFSSPEEIKNISGIKEGVYSKIADSIKVN